jgi:hypothetical protein
MAGDVKRLADVAAGFAEGTKFTGSVFGEGDNQIFYKYHCAQKGKYGPGDCAVYAIERSGPGVARLGLRPSDTVGNLFGLTEQLSRDIARMWCGAPSPTPGFERHRTRRRTR